MARQKNGHFYIDETCIGCGACDHACPGKVDAIYAVEMCPVDCIHDARQEGVVEGSGGYTKIKELQAWADAR
jgi:NAD-dependent dihydropyrimidine dehydrogenase PreA subunit